MASESRFFIDDKPYKLEHNPAKVSWLLQLVGTSSDETVLISADGVEHDNPDEPIEIQPGDQFKTRKRGVSDKPAQELIRYTVNGEESTTRVSPVLLETILRGAGPGAAIDLDDLGSYYLENTADGRKYENLNELVPVSDGDNFVAIHAGSTPVA